METPPSLPQGERKASPPTPLRMERGMKTIVCKWRGRFFDARRGSSRHKETPFSIAEGRFLFFTLSFPCLLTAVSFNLRWFVLLKLLAPFIIYCTASKLSCKSFPWEHSCTSWLFSNLLLLLNSPPLGRLRNLLSIWESNCFIYSLCLFNKNGG